MTSKASSGPTRLHKAASHRSFSHPTLYACERAKIAGACRSPSDSSLPKPAPQRRRRKSSTTSSDTPRIGIARPKLPRFCGKLSIFSNTGDAEAFTEKEKALPI
ncbi:hypothetical protein HPP92_024234 [Vanilla planifolia]|uniref:Uncharacterized protein n=1 Tax=Vanilla planifolia TaxID=51239 RepID=A0A835UAY9_VANPL|nr:hypothetical protein HPP92_024234 [Vanilla planifolia]